jgi:hypothetical protein
MGKMVSSITDAVGLTDSEAGARAVASGTRQQVDAQREALQYMKEREAVPQQFRESALNRLGGFYGLEGGDPGALEAVQSNPLYQATIGQLPQQEEAILRNQSATGALRSGGTDMMLAQNQRNNQLNAYQNVLGGLQGFASLPSNANNIANATAGIGVTQRQGTIGEAQSLAAGQQAVFEQATGAAKTAAQLISFSDIRLKTNVKPAGTRYAQSWFTWDWNKVALSLGLSGSSEGVIADKLLQTRPDLVGSKDGYLTVNYEGLRND